MRKDLRDIRNSIDLVRAISADFHIEHWVEMAKYFDPWAWNEIWSSDGSELALAKIYNTYSDDRHISPNKSIYNLHSIVDMALREAYSIPFPQRSGLPLVLASPLFGKILNGLDQFTVLSEDEIEVYFQAIMKIPIENLFEINAIREYIFKN